MQNQLVYVGGVFIFVLQKLKLEIKNNYMKSFINKYLKWIIIVLCLSVFFIISVTVYHKSAIGIDTRVYNFLDTHLILVYI